VAVLGRSALQTTLRTAGLSNAWTSRSGKMSEHWHSATVGLLEFKWQQ